MRYTVLRCLRQALSLLACFGVLVLAGTPASAADNFTPTTDFTDNGDGTVTHKLTGLTWMRCSMGQTWTGSTCSGTASSYTFDQARALTSTFAGKSDWRLPSPGELGSIVDYDIYSPAINSTIFPNTSSLVFWSGSPNANFSSNAWLVNFYYGVANYYNRSFSNSVRLVRGGQSLTTLTTPSSDFTDNVDGTVVHKPTNLTWKRCAEGQAWTGSSCSGTASSYTFDQAKALTSTFAGKNDWRIPNIQELQSIVEYGVFNPAINTTIFPTAPSSSFWSGSPDANDSNYAWFVYFFYGLAYYYYRYYSYSVRLVRGGQSFAPLPPSSATLTVVLSGSGSISGTGITCGSDCSESYSSGTKVTLTAKPTTGATFSGWSGACSGSTATCTVTMDATKTVKAGFTAQNPSDCVFDWAERDFPQYFSPAKASSAYYQNYYYRYYATTGVYLATNDNILWAIGPPTNNALLSLGPMSNFLQAAGCQ
jgi:hypothetical protein